MKKFKLIFLVLSILFFSCNNEEINEINNESNLNIKELAFKAMNTEITQEESREITNVYKSLNKKQLKNFFNFRDSFLLDKLNNQVQKMNFIKSKKYRNGIFEKSIDIFNKPINKLEGIEIERLFEIIELDNTSTNRLMRCPTASYPLSTCESVFIYNTDCSSYSRYGTPDDPTDCDYEYRFPGDKTQVLGTSWFAQQLIRHWGECAIARRFENNETKLLFGNRGVWFWLGSPYFGKTDLKMYD